MVSPDEIVQFGTTFAHLAIRRAAIVFTRAATDASARSPGCPRQAVSSRHNGWCPMGLFKLLLSPVTAPISGTRWVLQTVLDEAERQHYDEAAITQQLAELERMHRDGLVGDATYDRREEELLQRLLDARAYHRDKQERQQGG